MEHPVEESLVKGIDLGLVDGTSEGIWWEAQKNGEEGVCATGPCHVGAVSLDR